MPFKPGQSGNPGGKPKGTVSLVAKVRRYGMMGIDAVAEIECDESRPVFERVAAAFVTNLYWSAKHDDIGQFLAFFKEGADRLDGKPTQKNENTHQLVQESVVLEDRGLAEPALGEEGDRARLSENGNGSHASNGDSS